MKPTKPGSKAIVCASVSETARPRAQIQAASVTISGSRPRPPTIRPLKRVDGEAGERCRRAARPATPAPACSASAATTRRARRREPGEMSTERETMPIIAPTATIASAAFCSISVTTLASVAKRGLMMAKTTREHAASPTTMALRPSAGAEPAGLRRRTPRRRASLAVAAALDEPADDHRGEQQEAGHGGLPGAGHAADGHVVEDHHQDQRADDASGRPGRARPAGRRRRAPRPRWRRTRARRRSTG